MVLDSFANEFLTIVEAERLGAVRLTNMSSNFLVCLLPFTSCLVHFTHSFVVDTLFEECIIILRHLNSNLSKFLV